VVEHRLTKVVVRSVPLVPRQRIRVQAIAIRDAGGVIPRPAIAAGAPEAPMLLGDDRARDQPLLKELGDFLGGTWHLEEVSDDLRYRFDVVTLELSIPPKGST
jgi:hypothetical protein